MKSLTCAFHVRRMSSKITWTSYSAVWRSRTVQRIRNHTKSSNRIPVCIVFMRFYFFIFGESFWFTSHFRKHALWLCASLVCRITLTDDFCSYSILWKWIASLSYTRKHWFSGFRSNFGSCISSFSVWLLLENINWTKKKHIQRTNKIKVTTFFIVELETQLLNWTRSLLYHFMTTDLIFRSVKWSPGTFLT